jgi:hypothetical protein
MPDLTPMNADKRRCKIQINISRIKPESSNTRDLSFEYLLLCLDAVGVHRRSSASEIDLQGCPFE